MTWVNKNLRLMCSCVHDDRDDGSGKDRFAIYSVVLINGVAKKADGMLVLNLGKNNELGISMVQDRERVANEQGVQRNSVDWENWVIKQLEDAGKLGAKAEPCIRLDMGGDPSVFDYFTIMMEGVQHRPRYERQRVRCVQVQRSWRAHRGSQHRSRHQR